MSSDVLQPADADADLGRLERHCAHTYLPLPIVVAEAAGAWVTDVHGRRYLDALAAYSALNFGHRHPELLAAARAQLERVTLTSRAFHHDQLAPFCEAVCRLTGKEAVLPMNSGTEAVETSIKLVRRWGYQVKDVPPERATIVVADGNFHGRTTTIVGFSEDAQVRDGFGPFTPGFRRVPFGDAAALEAVIDATTVAVLLEPVQGEAGVRLPPRGYLTDVRRITRENDVLFVADEIQSGLGRTGRTFACDHEDVTPDVYVLGKALGGGIVPVSAVAADRDIMDVLTPGSHGSTFGGNPLACAVGCAVVRLLDTGEYQAASRRLGALLAGGLATLPADRVAGIRAIGLWAGIDVVPGGAARTVCERLLELGVLAKEAHGRTVRLSPPLVVTASDVERLVAALAEAVRR